MNKSTLKQGYYYEEKPWYDKCPDTLPEAPKFQTEIFKKTMTHREILDTYKIVPYASYQEAAAVACAIIPTLKNDYKGRLVYFKEGDTLFRFNVWRNGGVRLDLYVNGIDLDYEWDAEDGVCFSNGTLDASDSLSGSLSLESALEMVKSAGYRIFKEM